MQQQVLSFDTGQTVQVVDFVQKATFRASLLPNSLPTQGFRNVNNPARSLPSPFGWNSDGKSLWIDTRGNNVEVAIDSSRTSGGSNLRFTDIWNGNLPPDDPQNEKASTTHAFYIVNTFHDILFQYGFTPAAGNFQMNNNNKGGIGSDAVIVRNQNSDSFNNANFATPPDGQSGVLNLYLFTITNPPRDSSFDSMIVLHEYAHGLSNRLTGGPGNSACLQNTESWGLGEGWSDAIAIFMTIKSGMVSRNIGIGTWVSGRSQGVRRYLYSPDMNVNPLLFSNLKDESNVHRIGEIWATILMDLLWMLVDFAGFGTNWNDASQNFGNIVLLKIVVGAMMLQPCNPTFTQARDAILQAEFQYYKGAYRCRLWRGFAKRGLGSDSSQGQGNFANGYQIPSNC